MYNKKNSFLYIALYEHKTVINKQYSAQIHLKMEEYLMEELSSLIAKGSQNGLFGLSLKEKKTRYR